MTLITLPTMNSAPVPATAVSADTPSTPITPKNVLMPARIAQMRPSVFAGMSSFTGGSFMNDGLSSSSMVPPPDLRRARSLRTAYPPRRMRGRSVQRRAPPIRGLNEPRRCRRLRHACQTALNVYDAPRAPSGVLETDGLPLILDECLDRIVDLTRLIEVRNKVERWL